jgi:hypothetical protein
MVNQDRRAAGDVLDERVTALLDAASAPTEPGPLTGEAEAVLAFRVARARARKASQRPRVRTRAALAGVLGIGVLLTGGVGAATAGALPGAAQDRVGKLLSRVGVDVPGSRDRSDGRRSEQESADAAARELPEAMEKGQSPPEWARGEGHSGAEKGADESLLATDGRSDPGAWRVRDATGADDDAAEEREWDSSERTRGGTQDRDEDSDDSTKDDDCDREADDERDVDADDDDREADSERHPEADDELEGDCDDEDDEDDRTASRNVEDETDAGRGDDSEAEDEEAEEADGAVTRRGSSRTWLRD